MSGFRTKLDFSDNRQAKQRPITRTVLSGGTSFGVPFDLLPTGPNLTASAITNTQTYIASTFSGDNTSTVYSWADPRMQLGITALSALTSSTSGLTQQTGAIWTANTTTVIDGNTVALTYSGVNFDISVVTIAQLTPTTYSGTITTNTFETYSATSLDYTGRTIWVDVSGITRTEKLIISDNPQVGYVWTCLDSEGMGGWVFNSSATTATIWTAGTGANSAVLGGSGGIASGITSVSEGTNTIAGGDYSHAEGNSTIASGNTSHAEGRQTIAGGQYSHAGGFMSSAYSTNGFVHSNFSSINQTSDDSAILGGSGNEIIGSSINSGIFAGTGNTIENSSKNAAIIAGINNTISGHSNSVIVGGAHNFIDFCLNNYGGSLNEAILGGGYNKIYVADNSVVLGGVYNTIDGRHGGIGSSGSFVIGSVGSSAYTSNYSGIIGGSNNVIYESDCSYTMNSLIIGGYNNTYRPSNGAGTGTGQNNIILGGVQNVLEGPDITNSVLIGGSANGILTNLTNSVVIGGTNITATTNNTVYVPNLIVNSGGTASKIGINTNNPLQLLHLKSSNDAKILIEADTDNINENDNAELLLTQDGGGSTANFSITPDTLNNLLIGVNSATAPDILFATRSDSTVFTTSADTKMTLKNSGDLILKNNTSNSKFGVNTNNPQYVLDVNANTMRIYTNDNPLGSDALARQLVVSATSTNISQVGGLVSNKSITIGVIGESITPTATSVLIGDAKDAFLTSSMYTNNLNIVNVPNGGESNNIRAYAGITVDTATEPDIHIQGTGTTRGFVGFNNGNPDYNIDVYNTNKSSRLFYAGQAANGGSFNISASTGLPMIGVVAGTANAINQTASMGIGVRAWNDPTYTVYGYPGDAFIYAGIYTNGINIIANDGSTSGTGADYIRMYAGQSSGAGAGNAPDFHIGGTGSTRGFLGVNTGSPTQRLDINGNARFRSIGSSASAGALHYTSDGTLTTNTSDERLKTNIETLTSALEKVKQLRGVKYNWTEEPNGDVRIGLIAQEVNSVVPELTFVNKNTEEQYMGVHYDNVVALLIEAIKELSSGSTISNNSYLETQTILAEDNNIELNYNGTQQTSLGGGLKVLHAKGQDLSADLITDENGDFVTNNDFKPNALTIPLYTPTSSNDVAGSVGNLTRDDNYLYVKTSTGWKRTNLENF
jgi:hypothetical protein